LIRSNELSTDQIVDVVADSGGFAIGVDKLRGPMRNSFDIARTTYTVDKPTYI
jgi:hypothetical protein